MASAAAGVPLIESPEADTSTQLEAERYSKARFAAMTLMIVPTGVLVSTTAGVLLGTALAVSLGLLLLIALPIVLLVGFVIAAALNFALTSLFIRPVVPPRYRSDVRAAALVGPLVGGVLGGVSMNAYFAILSASVVGVVATLWAGRALFWGYLPPAAALALLGGFATSPAYPGRDDGTPDPIRLGDHWEGPVATFEDGTLRLPLPGYQATSASLPAAVVASAPSVSYQGAKGQTIAVTLLDEDIAFSCSAPTTCTTVGAVPEGPVQQRVDRSYGRTATSYIVGVPGGVWSVSGDELSAEQAIRVLDLLRPATPEELESAARSLDYSAALVE